MSPVSFRFKQLFYNPTSSDNVNVNVFKYGDSLLAVTDAPTMQLVKPSDLHTEGKVLCPLMRLLYFFRLNVNKLKL